MTREEAIDLLDNLIGFVEDNHGSDYDEALKIAIKVIKQEPKLLDTLDFAVDASNGDTNYFVGFRNGLRYAKSLIDGEEPQFESCIEQEPQTDVLDKIRADIDRKQYDFMESKDYDEGVRFGLMLAYQIIDKYAESEESNGTL